VSGFRVELGEVQHHLRQHPQVGDAIVRADDGRLVAYVTPSAAGAAGTAQATQAEPSVLRAFLESRLPQHMVPATYVKLAEMPTTSWGKVDVASLPTPTEVLSPSGGQPADLPAATPVERYLVAKVSEMLGTPVGTGDDLFLLGVESVLVARLTNLVNSDLQVKLKEIEVFDNPTISSLAKHISERIVVPR
jgi:hypothetical protein